MSVTFTIGDIAMAAASAKDANAEDNVQRFLNVLRHAGYVVELPIRQRGTRLTSNGFKRFRLLKNTGPLAPGVRRRDCIHDWNTGEDVPCAKNR